MECGAPVDAVHVSPGWRLTRVAQVDLRPEALGNRCPLELGVLGEVTSGDQAMVLLSSSPWARTRSFEPSSEMTRSSLRLRMKAMLLPSGDHIGAVSISTP